MFACVSVLVSHRSRIILVVNKAVFISSHIPVLDVFRSVLVAQRLVFVVNRVVLIVYRTIMAVHRQVLVAYTDSSLSSSGGYWRSRRGF